MNLKFIKTDKCPICGCDTVISESVDTGYNNTKVLEHCNGGLWENRDFLCGFKVKYSPNFAKEEYVNNCRNDESKIALKKKTKQFYMEVLDFLDELHDFELPAKEQLISSLEAKVDDLS